MRRITPLNLLLLLLVLALAGCKDRSTSGTAPRRIIFVTIDTLRADHLAELGYVRETAPFISSLIRRGALFTKALTASSHTAPSHASMFTSRYPFEHGVLKNHDTIAPQIFHLRTLLEQARYRTAAFVAVRFLDGKLGFDAEPEVAGMKRGFPKRFWYRPAEKLMNRTLTWLESQAIDNPLFLWLHFYDVHEWQSKGNLPLQYMTEMKGTDQSALLAFLKDRHRVSESFFKDQKEMLRAFNSYDGRLRYVDDQLSRLDQALKARGATGETLWIVTSDHGEGLGNHNYGGHGEFLYNEQLHVPLVISSDAQRFPQRVVKELVRTVDLLPTIADVIGQSVDRTKQQIRGVSLLPLLSSGGWSRERVEHSFAQRRPKDTESFRKSWEAGELYAIQDEGAKLIDHSHEKDDFFDLRSDPFELNNLTSDPREVELRELLGKILAGPHAEPVPNQSLAPDEIEELKSLGYM